MKYTKQQRTDIANALKAAKPFLAKKRGDGKTSYICNALRDGGADGWYNAKDIVMERICPHGTFRNWLDSNVEFDDSNGYIPMDGHPKVQAHRHAWLDQLIEEFSV